MIEEKITSPSFVNGDIDETLRPSSFNDFIGQDKVKDNIKIFVEASKIRKSVLDHVVLYGPPGLGKTTLARIISNELQRNIKITSAPAIEKQGDLIAILTTLEEGDIIFIDEIHRLKKNLEEVLYSAMEDFKVDIIIGEGTGARTIRLNLPHFTLIGATTRIGSLTGPLRSRFGIIERLDFYDEKSLKQIVGRSSKILGIKISEDALSEIAKRSRGTPRIANRLLKRVSDFALVEKVEPIDRSFSDYALTKLEIDHKGLDAMDRKILEIIIKRYKGGPVGLSAISATINEEIETLEDVYEPFLIQQGFLLRTPRGRVASKLAYEHLGIKYHSIEEDLSLF
ncbi:MAG: Holliday junction branch migration DNA helicase RuvB [Brevinematales bacterium]|nr:Holliday junction branch migration DNA helicase RuvB [Brevinematales bacterium]